MTPSAKPSPLFFLAGSSGVRMTIVSFIQQVTQEVTAAAWALFVLTWTIGWTLRGAPIPLRGLKRAGASFIEDSIWAALWLALGSTIFTFIVYVVKVVTGSP
ncbi:MAG: hypothetical protein CISAcid_00860 [uncultured Acidilobus sp. CIS]|nr:MAG: hypothetical protein CISAcid_00860 [uncultured Acidilobus sp. CIS]